MRRLNTDRELSKGTIYHKQKVGGGDTQKDGGGDVVSPNRLSVGCETTPRRQFGDSVGF